MASELLDFRSDTVTRPDQAMYKAIVEAPLGDDVLGDEPTVQKLETAAAEIFNTEAALYVPSGSMGNLCCIGAQTSPGDEVIMEEYSHIYNFEAAGSTTVWSVQPRTLKSDRGAMDPEDVKAAVRPESLHLPRTRLICIENTHNFHGGAVVPIENIEAIGEIARENGLRLHIDGARIFNASIASGVKPQRYMELADSMSVCLSKGLGAPVGSVVVGKADFIDKCRRLRKTLGGGMRQAGVIAAAGLVALTENVRRLADDHANARTLAKGLAEIEGVIVYPESVDTNIVTFRLEDGFPSYEKVLDKLKENGLMIVTMAGLLLRAVTHKDVTAKDTEKAVEILQKTLPGLRKKR